MTWSQFARARQLLAEEGFGIRARGVQEAEERDFARSIAALRKEQGAS